MKIVCSCKVLQKAFQLAASVISSRTIRPIHQNVKMDVVDDAVHLISTDGDIDLRVGVTGAVIKEAGAVLLPASRVAGILRESIGEDIEIGSIDGGAHIVGVDSHFRVLSESPEEYPDVAKVCGEKSFDIAADVLNDMIAKTSFSAAQDTTRYSLNGVLFSSADNNLVLVATDGRRMAKIQRKLPDLTNKFDDIIIPTKALVEVGKIMQGSDSLVGVHVGEREITFVCGSSVVSARAIAGSFPRYEDAIPTDGDKRVEINAVQLLSGVRRSALLTSVDARMVKFAFGPEGLTLSSSSIEAGEATIKIDAKADFDEMAIAFNPSFIEDVLRVTDVETITMVMKSKDSQVLVRAGENYLYVIMPVILPE